ncbi:hypothetical protein Ancab_021243 [Ancistrocladus abbreviatus]
MESSCTRLEVFMLVLCILMVKCNCITKPLKPLMPCKFPALFNFGDSNSDTGGLSAAFGQAPPPNGETFFHSPAGRYSDGRLLIDFIAQSMGLPYLSAYLDSIGSKLSVMGPTLLLQDQPLDLRIQPFIKVALALSL